MSPITFPLNPGDNNDNVTNLKAALVFIIEKQQLGLGTEDSATMPTLLNQEAGYSVTTMRLITMFQQLRQLPATGLVDEATAAALNRVLTELGALKPNVNGVIYMDYGVPADNVKLRLYTKGFAGADKMVGEANTNAQGGYAFMFNPAGVANASFEVRALDATGKEYALSSTLYAGANEPAVSDLNLIAPTAIRPVGESEFKRLTNDVLPIIGDMAKLSEAVEKDDRQDITFLSNSTNWDAKTIALASLAGKISKATSLSQESAYALVRAGLPTDADQLAQLNPDDVKKALKTASDAGAVSLNDESIKATMTAFQTFANRTRLTTKDFSSLSNYDELLSTQQLSENEKNQFANAYFAKRKDGAELWQKAKESGIPEAKIKNLQLQGKLGMLTANNAALMQNLQSVVADVTDLPKLVEQGLYEPAAWDTRIKALAATNDNNSPALEKFIPPAYIGDTIADRKEAYITDMATKIREAFPEKILRHRIENNKITLGNDAVQKGVSTMLGKAEGLGYKIGSTHIDTFVGKNQAALFNGATADQKAVAVNGLKTLTRIHQVTPNDEAMSVLLELGHSSAQDIVAVPKDDFISLFAKKYSDKYKIRLDEGYRIARLIYNKSQQVYTTTYSFYTATQTMQQTPPVFAISGTPEKQAADQKSLADKIKGSPNLEQLFGSLDFGEVEHCRSVLSPAAYLVDLLQFLDRKPTDWQYFLDKWKADHGGDNYEAKFAKPYDALIDRRPDIVNLSLTRENTETALPYIDLVNEILEYYVVNKKLESIAAHDTDDSTTAELLAEPQYVLPKAYGILRESNYPLRLPFDLWLETVREFCQQNDASLAQVLKSIQPLGGADFETKRKIAVESLNISPAEYKLLTNETPFANLFALYGFANAAEMNTQLKSAKKLSNRLGITYKELYSLMQTEFINPQWKNLVLLHKMSVTINDVFRYMKHPGFAPFSPDEQLAFDDRLSQIKTAFGLDAKAALTKAWTDGVYKQMLLLNDTNAGFNFDATKVGYADRDAEPFDWLKFNLFVRLWKRMGWTIDEVDAALAALLPKNLKDVFDDAAKPDADRAKALAQGLGSALINMAHLKELSSRVNVGKGAYTKLSALWNDIRSVGKNSLYKQLFLVRNVATIDSAFDDALGQYLTKDIAIKETTKDHSIAIQAALSLSASDMELILRENNQNLDTAKLTMANLSLIYRHVMLSKALRLTIPELIALIQLSGVNPFAPLSVGAMTANEDDHLLNDALKFVELASKVKESGFKLEDLGFLLRHQFDPTGKYRNMQANADAAIRLLANEISRIHAVYAVPANPANAADVTPFTTFTDEVLQQHLSLVMKASSVQVFMSMWSGRQTPEWNPLEDDLKKLFTEANFNSLFVPDAADADDKTKQNNNLQKRATIAKALLPHIRQQLIRESIAQQLSSLLSAAPTQIKWLISDAGRLHLAAAPTASLMDLFSTANDVSKASVNAQAFTLLTKVNQLINGLSLSDREVRHIINHAARFANLDIHAIPVDDSPAIAKVQGLFTSFMRLLDYAVLRKKLTGGGDDLIDLFEKANAAYDSGSDAAATKSQHLNTLHQQIANLTRRDVANVSAIASALGVQATSQIVDGKLVINAEAYSDERGVSMLWEALQVTQSFGVPIETLLATKEIINPGLDVEKCQIIADNFKHAVKAKYEPDAWLLVAQPIFDRLRQRRRDALVSYMLHTYRDNFESLEEMYEYFLVDPGTEPVVQTSRVRLATASVQLFIQRCLLNLENRWAKKVSPAAINAKHWQWMNRYRVWEANRKIFLWPENWLEPEWRDDKTHLFKEIEGKLLQGDVSNDLVEDAFYNYLQKLEELARLNIIAMHCEEDPVTPEANSLYVVARTYSFPHKYFYRKYAQEMWTPWEPVDAEIDGDHIVTTIWRGRLHILWVTFIEKMVGKQPQLSGATGETKLWDWKVTHALSTVAGGSDTKTIEAHLHWCEYYQGKWSMKKSTGLEHVVSKVVQFQTTPNSIVITISKEPKINDSLDGALRISLSGLGGFRLVNKNSPPEIIPEGSLPGWKFTAGKYHKNHIDIREGKFAVSFPHLVKTLNGSIQEVQSNPQVILGDIFGNATIVPCSAPVTMGGVEFGPLVTPFFYQDSWNTFYVQPELTEKVTINEWDEWVGGLPSTYNPPRIDWDKVKIEPYHPWPKDIPIPRKYGDPGWIDPKDTRVKVLPRHLEDWTTNPNTYIKFGDRVIGNDTSLKVMVANGNSTSPIAVKDGLMLNTIIHHAADAQDVVLLPTGTTLSANTAMGDLNAMTDTISVKDTVLVGDAGITTSRPVIISRPDTAVSVATTGLLGRHVFNRGF